MLVAACRGGASTSSPRGAPAVPAATPFPNLLPAVTATPVSDTIVWNSVTPRVGATWALGEDRRTIVRAAYSMFAQQLGSSAASIISPIQAASITFQAVDQNGNKLADASELDLRTASSPVGFDPLNPARLTSANQIGGTRAADARSRRRRGSRAVGALRRRAAIMHAT